MALAGGRGSRRRPPTWLGKLYCRWEGLLAKRLTTEELARHILRRFFEATDGRPMEWRTLKTNKTADAAIELAIERGWLIVEDRKGARVLLRAFQGRRDFLTELAVQTECPLGGPA